MSITTETAPIMNSRTLTIVVKTPPSPVRFVGPLPVLTDCNPFEICADTSTEPATALIPSASTGTSSNPANAVRIVFFISFFPFIR